MKNSKIIVKELCNVEPSKIQSYYDLLIIIIRFDSQQEWEFASKLKQQRKKFEKTKQMHSQFLIAL